MWKWAEDHLPIQPVYPKADWFESNGDRFKQFTVNLAAFCTYAVKLANGSGGKRWIHGNPSITL